MSSTPEPTGPTGPPALVLRDDRPAPEGFEGSDAEGALLVAVEASAVDAVDAASVDAAPVAAAVVGGDAPVLRLHHLWVRPDRRRRGVARQVLALLRRRVAAQGATVLTAEVRHDDPAATALATGTPVLGEFMVRPLPAAAAPLDRLTYRPMTAEEFGPWREAQVQAYARDNLQRSGGDLGRALERSRADFARFLPDGLQTADSSIVVLTAAGGRVGHLWLGHHVDPGMSFVFDVVIAEQHRGRGFGRAAMVVADRLARDAGDEQVGLHVFGGNTVARSLYLSHGYAVRSTTHDLLSPAEPA